MASCPPSLVFKPPYLSRYAQPFSPPSTIVSADFSKISILLIFIIFIARQCQMFYSTTSKRAGYIHRTKTSSLPSLSFTRTQNGTPSPPCGYAGAFDATPISRSYRLSHDWKVSSIGCKTCRWRNTRANGGFAPICLSLGRTWRTA